LLICKRIKIFFNRALARFEPIEFDFLHGRRFAYMRTCFKWLMPFCRIVDATYLIVDRLG
jgi:hypothetical protein